MPRPPALHFGKQNKAELSLRRLIIKWQYAEAIVHRDGYKRGIPCGIEDDRKAPTVYDPDFFKSDEGVHD
jgi:hypothetical protein